MDRYRVKPDDKIDLDKFDPEDTSAYEGDKSDGKDRLQELTEELEGLQELLYAQGKHKVLVVLQGMDTSGKDGVIRHVFDGVNPQGVRVAGFKVPTPPELARDYLWRVHRQVPAAGEIVIFNRSHYEDVLVVRVHDLVPPERWKQRYDQINDFEKMLTQEGTTILKFYLHIKPEEQRQRLLDRLNEPAKHWKFNPGDIKERERWGDYQKAYEDVLEKTSTKWAPWYIVPSNKKWYRNLVIASLLVKTLQGFEMKLEAHLEDVPGLKAQLGGD